MTTNIPPVVDNLRLDLGCGKKKQEGSTGVDIFPFEGVDVVHDLSKAPWPFADDSVDSAYSAHFVEHLTGEERIVFFNELYRVLKPGAQANIVTPDWSHASAYGDPTHKWPPISSWYALYLNKAWRDSNAPHTDAATTGGFGYSCDFDYTTGCSFDEWLFTRNQEMKMFALARYVNSARELIVTFTSRKPNTPTPTP